MKGLLVVFMVIVASLTITLNTGKEMSMLTVGGIIFAFVGLIALLIIAVQSGRKVSYAEAN
jgi:hypothetical protein